MIAIPEPGHYVLADSHGGRYPKCWVEVLGPSACGGPHFDAVFRNSNMHARSPGIRRTVRVAVDGSWRDVTTLLPLNCYGETFQ